MLTAANSVQNDVITANILLKIAQEYTKDNSELFEDLLNALFKENNLPAIKLKSLRTISVNSTSLHKTRERNNNTEVTRSPTTVSVRSRKPQNPPNKPVTQTAHCSPQAGGTVTRTSPVTHKQPTTNTPTSFPDDSIQIYKRADYNKEITKKNIKKLSKDGKVIVYSNTLSEVECLDRLVDRSIDCTVFFF